MNYDIKTISRIKDIVCEHSPTYEDIKNDRNVMFEFYNIIQERHASWFSSGNLDLSTGKKSMSIYYHLKQYIQRINYFMMSFIEIVFVA